MVSVQSSGKEVDDIIEIGRDSRKEQGGKGDSGEEGLDNVEMISDTGSRILNDFEWLKKVKKNGQIFKVDRNEIATQKQKDIILINSAKKKKASKEKTNESQEEASPKKVIFEETENLKKRCFSNFKNKKEKNLPQKQDITLNERGSSRTSDAKTLDFRSLPIQNKERRWPESKNNKKMNDEEAGDILPKRVNLGTKRVKDASTDCMDLDSVIYGCYSLRPMDDITILSNIVIEKRLFIKIRRNQKVKSKDPAKHLEDDSQILFVPPSILKKVRPDLLCQYLEKHMKFV
jgi:hypothetical protein